MLGYEILTFHTSEYIQMEDFDFKSICRTEKLLPVYFCTYINSQAHLISNTDTVAEMTPHQEGKGPGHALVGLAIWEMAERIGRANSSLYFLKVKIEKGLLEGMPD